MQQRQQRVKDSREQREREATDRLRQQQVAKDMQLREQAERLRVEREQLAARKLEEKRMQLEEARLKREATQLAAEREAAAQEQRRIEEALQLQVRAREAEAARLRRLEAEAAARLARDQQREHEAMCRRMEALASLDASRRARALQRCFSAWYGLALTRRRHVTKMLLGARVRTLLQLFNHWKGLTRTRIMSREAELVHQEALHEQQRLRQARIFHESKVLSAAFLSWQVWARKQRRQQELAAEQAEKQAKMQRFLQAAAEGKLRAAPTAPAPPAVLRAAEPPPPPKETDHDLDDIVVWQPRGLPPGPIAKPPAADAAKKPAAKPNPLLLAMEERALKQKELRQARELRQREKEEQAKVRSHDACTPRVNSASGRKGGVPATRSNGSLGGKAPEDGAETARTKAGTRGRAAACAANGRPAGQV